MQPRCVCTGICYGDLGNEAKPPVARRHRSKFRCKRTVVAKEPRAARKTSRTPDDDDHDDDDDGDSDDDDDDNDDRH